MNVKLTTRNNEWWLFHDVFRRPGRPWPPSERHHLLRWPLAMPASKLLPTGHALWPGRQRPFHRVPAVWPSCSGQTAGHAPPTFSPPPSLPQNHLPWLRLTTDATPTVSSEWNLNWVRCLRPVTFSTKITGFTGLNLSDCSYLLRLVAN